jgi:CDGSH-type Zn-finger protein/truncated hemoglobin YjbI
MTEPTAAGRGSLAQTIATRGGQAAPEAPFRIEHREALIYMLCEAAELEHAIMCQYLFAAFSLKQSTDEGLTPEELEAVKRWGNGVSHIATQEMLHLALVQNLLSAVGAAPHLSRPNLPQPAGHYPPGVILTLLPFGEDALQHFMFLERPEGMDLADAPGLAALERAAPAMEAGEIVPRLQDFATVGHLYRSIEEGVKHLCAKYGEPWLFVGPPEAQAGEAHFGWPQLVQVTDAASAQRAVDTILEQGEGPRGDWRSAHFGLFVDILDEYQQLKLANPSFEPARPVLPATVRPSERDATIPLIGDNFAARCTDLFNVSYEILLQTLARYFAHTDETEPQLAALAQVTMGLMFSVIKPLGQLVSALPVGKDAPGRTAGPSFELFYESDYGLPHREAAWALIEERLREAAAFADRVKHDGPPDTAARLQPIGPALLELAHSLATCRADWGGRSHAGEVTVDHRRRDAERARANSGVPELVDRLASGIKGVMVQEQAFALEALLAAATVGARTTGDPAGADSAVTRRTWKRGLLTEFDRRSERVVNLADLLVAVLGHTDIEPPTIRHRALDSLVDDSDNNLTADYEDITRLLAAVPPEALLIDPHPSPDYATEEQRRPLPGVVDQGSALALIDQITATGGGGLRDLTQQLPIDSSAGGPPPRDSQATTDNPTIQLARLFRDAYDTLLCVLGCSVSQEHDVIVGRHRLRDISTRLRRRVLRPLAEALCQSPGDPTSVLITEYQTLRESGSSTAEDRLRVLAISATSARVNSKLIPPELLEATAAAQDLALTYAVSDDGDREALLVQLRRAETTMPRSIQLARNGPYLMTNVDQLTDRLGDPIETRPQMALCRCGESDAKPWCDGSHALSDFTDNKDPNRVPDRLDTYPGMAITILDNRGICQHSGFCTDRLPLAFRVDQEPFVAPSGARMDEIIQAVRNCPSGALSFAVDGRDAREDVDWHNQRDPAVAVTQNGPYRISGGIPLVEPSGDPVERNQGASVEHYALCRCGHSQNKPFCSGMHWYVDFRDPIPDPARPPTLYEWLGGMPPLIRMTRIFLEDHVPEDRVLAPPFANAPADLPERLAAWLGEVFGGPPRNQDGDHVHPLAAPDGSAYTEQQRARWVSLLSRSAQESGFPTDAEFWAAFTSYLEWQSRQIVPQPGTDAVPPPDQQTPRWDWGPAGPPSPVVEPETDETAAEPTIPEPGQPVSFATHIKPLFRQRDRQSMTFAFDLWSYDAVKEHAESIADRLRAGTMPCDGAWPEQKTELFQRWIDDGTAP